VIFWLHRSRGRITIDKKKKRTRSQNQMVLSLEWVSFSKNIVIMDIWDKNLF
jgi:hypothetical protein